MALVVPADAAAPVPAMIMFGGGALPPAAGEPAVEGPCRGADRPRVTPPGAAPADPPPDRAIDSGGVGLRVPEPDQRSSRQRRRPHCRDHRPDQQGRAARARRLGRAARWAWGASRAIDYFATDGGVDAERVASGRIAVRQSGAGRRGLRDALRGQPVASSGEGGAKLFRRNFGEAARESGRRGRLSLDGWQSSSTAATEAEFGRQRRRPAGRRHELIALCAPRPRSSATAFPSRATRTGSTSAAASWPPCGRAAYPAARHERSRHVRRLLDRTAARRECRAPRRRARLATARWRAHERTELEVFHPVGRRDARSREAPGRRINATRAGRSVRSVRGRRAHRHGGMGEVYRAPTRGCGRDVALKVLRDPPPSTRSACTGSSVRPDCSRR